MGRPTAPPPRRPRAPRASCTIEAIRLGKPARTAVAGPSAAPRRRARACGGSPGAACRCRIGAGARRPGCRARGGDGAGAPRRLLITAVPLHCCSAAWYRRRVRRASPGSRVPMRARPGGRARWGAAGQAHWLLLCPWPLCGAARVHALGDTPASLVCEQPRSRASGRRVRGTVGCCATPGLELRRA